MKFQIDVAPSIVPNDGEFTYHTWTIDGDRVASGYRETQQAALEEAREAAKRFVDHPPIREDFEYGE